MMQRLATSYRRALSKASALWCVRSLGTIETTTLVKRSASLGHAAPFANPQEDTQGGK